MIESTIQKKLSILSAVNRLHHDIGAHLGLEETSNRVVDILREITHCDACAIILIDGENVEILAERGFTTTLINLRFTTDMSAIKHIIETKEILFTNDLEKDAFLASCIPEGCSLQSLVCAPILVKEEVKGIIHVDSREKNAFDEDDLELVQLLAEETSLILERSLLYEQVKALTLRDALTGTFNRRKLEEDLESEIARSKRYLRPLSILMIDIDWFKHYNDYHGHQKGDEVLRKVASLLVHNMRSIDRVYRYGGEEFVVMLPETDKQEAMACAERLREKVEREPFEGEKESQPNGRLTISIGVASFPLDADAKEKLIEAADFALYRAKAIGRNRVCIY